MKNMKLISQHIITISIASFLICGCSNVPETKESKPVVEEVKHDWGDSLTNNYNHLLELLKDSNTWNLIGEETKMNRDCDIYQHKQEPLTIWVLQNHNVVVESIYELDEQKIFRCRAQSIKKEDGYFRVRDVKLFNSLTREKIDIESTSEMKFP